MRSDHATLAAGADDIAAVRTITAAELAAYQAGIDAARVVQTVVSLRSKAAVVVEAEMARLAGRLGANEQSLP